MVKNEIKKGGNRVIDELNNGNRFLMKKLSLNINQKKLIQGPEKQNDSEKEKISNRYKKRRVMRLQLAR